MTFPGWKLHCFFGFNEAFRGDEGLASFEQQLGEQLSQREIHQLYLDALSHSDYGVGPEQVAKFFTGDVTWTEEAVDRWGTQTIIHPGKIGLTAEGFEYFRDLLDKTSQTA